MLGDSVLLDNEEDLQSLRKLAIHFEHIFSSDKMSKLESDLKNIKNKTQFLRELRSCSDYDKCYGDLEENEHQVSSISATRGSYSAAAPFISTCRKKFLCIELCQISEAQSFFS